MKVSSLSSAPYNPRKISEEQLKKLKKSLEEFGDLSGVVFNKRTGNLIGGHQRVRIFKEEDPQIDIKERTQTEVIGSFKYKGHLFTYRQVDWDEKKEKKANITANNPHIQGYFTDELQLMLDELKLEEDFIPLGLDALITEKTEENKTEEDGGAGAIPKVPVAKLGDIYELNDHILMCGDSTSSEQVKTLIGKKPVQMTFTDPPYNVAYDQNRGPKRKPTKTDGTIKNDKMSREDFEKFVEGFMINILDNTAGGIYICMSSKEWGTIMNGFESNGGHWSATIIWNKNNFVIGRADYHRKFEPILYGWKEGNKRYFTPDRKQSDVWDIAKPQKSILHPTMKPVQLVGQAIVNSSRAGDSVLDLFTGSGSTLIACEQLDRQFRGMELDERFIDVIVQRWIKYMEERGKKYNIKRNGEEVTKEELYVNN